MPSRRENGHFKIRCELARGQFPPAIELERFVNPGHPPALGNRAELGLLEVARKKIDRLGRDADWSPAVALRCHRIEIDKPRREERRPQLLKDSIHPLVQSDFVIKCAKNLR